MSDLSVERRMINAYRAGQEAARVAPFRPNPHNGISPDRVERVLSKMWRRGYQSQNPMPTPTDE
jgi:hypothetical protein